MSSIAGLTDRGTVAAYFTGNTTILNAEELHHSAGRHPLVAGVSKSTLSRLETGQRKPSVELLLPPDRRRRPLVVMDTGGSDGVPRGAGSTSRSCNVPCNEVPGISLHPNAVGFRHGRSNRPLTCDNV